MSLRGFIRDVPETSDWNVPGRQIGMSPGWSNSIFREHSGDVILGRPREVLRINIYQLGSKTINYNETKYYVFISNTENNFSELKDPVTFLNRMREGKPTLKQRKMNKKHLIDT